MTTAATSYPLIGSQPVGNFWVADVFSTSPTDLINTFAKAKLGSVIQVQDPYWGGLELIYLRVAASQTVLTGSLLSWDVSWKASLLANTANQAMPVAVALNPVTTGANQSAVIWAVVSGRFPVLCTASVAAGSPIGIQAAGKGGASGAGKEIENMVSVAASSITVVKSLNLTNGSTIATITGASQTYPTGFSGTGADGWLVDPGLVLSGTGIAAGTTVSTIDPDNRRVVLSAAATSGGIQTVTGTYNDGGTNHLVTATFDRPFAQGRIT